jgi:hypothetical protein
MNRTRQDYKTAEDRLPDDAEHSGRERNALLELSDEIMSLLHAEQLKHESVPSAMVTEWLRELYDIAQVGSGKSRHFRRDTSNDAKAAK